MSEPQARVYPLDPRTMSQEEMAVTFAMTSRSPRPFDEIAQEVTEEKAAGFHERWVIGYGHSSVAEHAVIHMALENISRLACDTLEDNRLASYTEKSSRYQVIDQNSFHTPEELRNDPQGRRTFTQAAETLFNTYHRLLEGVLAYLRMSVPREEGERNSAYELRIRRTATDSCRSVLPAATLTNVGVTINARNLEHAISKLASSPLMEEQWIAGRLLEEGEREIPTLLRHAGETPHLRTSMRRARQLTIPMNVKTAPPEQQASIVSSTKQPQDRIVAALLFREFPQAMEEIEQQVRDMGQGEKMKVINSHMKDIGDHEPAIREFELASYTFELTMDYGAYREFRRHRMQSCYPQPMTMDLGYQVPRLITDAGLAQVMNDGVETAEQAHRELCMRHPNAAQYLVTHAHHRRLTVQMNLRECYHIFKLRTSMLAHESVRRPMLQAMKLAVKNDPGLFQWLRLRDYPDWWPHPAPARN